MVYSNLLIWVVTAAVAVNMLAILAASFVLMLRGRLTEFGKKLACGTLIAFLFAVGLFSIYLGFWDFTFTTHFRTPRGLFRH